MTVIEVLLLIVAMLAGVALLHGASHGVTRAIEEAALRAGAAESLRKFAPWALLVVVLLAAFGLIEYARDLVTNQPYEPVQDELRMEQQRQLRESLRDSDAFDTPGNGFGGDSFDTAP